MAKRVVAQWRGADETDFDVRPSRVAPSFWIVFRRATGNGVAHPACDGSKHDFTTPCSLCFHTSEAAAREALRAWCASPHIRARKRKLGAQPNLRPLGKTLAQELAALCAWMAERDRNPWHGWKPCAHKHGLACDQVAGARNWSAICARYPA